MNLGTTYIKSRRSVRKYKNTPVPEEAIRDALECARLAPTARNAQAWLFGVVKEPEKLAAIAGMTTHGKFIKDAQVCFFVFCERDHDYFIEDGCAATTQMALALMAHGVYSCWVAGNQKEYAEEIRNYLNVPERYALIALLPAGYPEDITIPKKKTLDEIVFYETFTE